MIFDAIRAAAALMVLFGHANGIFSANSAHWPQQLGVVIFFLLSGYLISQTLHRRLARPNSIFLDYAIDRWSRIYSGFLPAVVFVLILDRFMIANYPGVHIETVQRSTVELLLANLAMLQLPAWFLPFGSAAPFWTVAIEFWIYIFVGLIAFSVRDGLSPIKIALIVGAGLVPMSCVTDNNMVFVPWLLGACVERVVAGGWLDRIPRPALATIAAASAVGLIVVNRGAPHLYNYGTYFASAVAFAPIALFAEKFTPTDSRWQSLVVWSASWSYSLYLLHHSILMSVANAHGGKVLAITASIGASIVFASVTEAHHKRLASYLKSWFRRRLPAADRL